MKTILLHGVIASPYLLKMQSMLAFSGRPWARWPDQAGPWAALGFMLRRTVALVRGRIERFGGMSDHLDEYPSVPFYTLDGSHFYYDSSSLAYHLDALPAIDSQPAPLSLLPEDPVQRFICQLIDEAFDEYGLYMVHHNRWVTSATTTPMGVLTAAEMRHLLPFGLQARVARALPLRQVRRCPYLFSVAPTGFSAPVAAQLVPPAREGFPPTHELLNASWRSYLAAMEQLLEIQPYILGQRFTLADASAYGQLSMNLIDGVAEDLLQALAPRTYTWLCDIRDDKHVDSAGELYISEHLQPLLDIICQTFIPLMQQNDCAYEDAIAAGESLFNEKAFDKGRALYDGEIMGAPFRAVVKTFQVQVWRDLKANWQGLSKEQQVQVAGYLPQVEL